MKKSFAFFVTLIFLGFALLKSVHAGGGRVLIYNVSQGVAGTTPSYFSAQVFKYDTMSSDFSQGERFEVRIENPRSGDKCHLNAERTSDIGMLTGTCEATTPGSYLMYLYSLDLENESSRHYVYFDNAPSPTPKATILPVKTPLPMKSPSPTPTLTPKASPSSSPIISPTYTPYPLQEEQNVNQTVIENNSETQKQNILEQVLNSILRFFGLKK